MCTTAKTEVVFEVHLPLLVLEQLCLRTGAWCSAFRRASRFSGLSLTALAASEALLPGSLVGSGGDSMLYFRGLFSV